MNDTHGQNGQGWYGFDLDGTLAVYTVWRGIDHIGEPVKPMVDRIKRMHEEGKVVKVLTARVAPRANVETRSNPYFGMLPDGFRLDVPHTLGEEARSWCENRYHEEWWDAKMFIVDWCANHLGFIPEITHEKDHLMLELYDDRVRQVVPNKGILVDDIARGLALEARRYNRTESAAAMVAHALIGALTATVLFGALLGLFTTPKSGSPERAVLDAVHELETAMQKAELRKALRPSAPWSRESPR